MKKNILKLYLLISIAFSIVICFTSCSGPESDIVTTPSNTTNTDTIPNNTTPAFSIVGEWLEDLSGNGIINFGVYNYYSNGAMASYEVDIEKDPGNCYIFDFEGKYTISGKKWIQTQNHPLLGNMKYESEIIKLSKYDFVFYFEEEKLTGYQHRIINTYNMNVGDTKAISIDDNDFIPQKYSSNHERIAVVNNQGVVTAKEIGTAFICVESSIGTAAIRIIVTDPDNLFCDFSKYLDVNIDDIAQSFGKEFIDISGEYEISDRCRNYNLYDNFINNVDFFYDSKDKIVKYISPTFRAGVDTNTITNFLTKKFDFIEKNNEGLYYYGKGIRILFDNNGKIEYKDKTIILTWSPLERTIIYGIYDDEPIDDSSLNYYDFHQLLGVPMEEIINYLGDNFSESYVSDPNDRRLGATRISGGVMHYPARASDNLEMTSLVGDSTTSTNFNGYEKTYQSIEFEYPASGLIILGGGGRRQVSIDSRGDVKQIKLVFLDNINIDKVSEKLGELFNFQQMLMEEDGSILQQYVDTNSNFYVYWNHTKRTLIYILNNKNAILK